MPPPSFILEAHIMRTNHTTRPIHPILPLLLLLSLFPSTFAADGPDQSPIDWDRAKALYQREQHGDHLTPDEQAYLDRAKAERRKTNTPASRPAITNRETTGLVPLTQFKPDEKYKAQEGGLYGAGRNSPPQPLAKLAEAATAQIAPLNADGKPAADGKIVLMSIGMSNTTQEFSRFKQIADADAEKSPLLTIVDAAQGGKDAAAWTANTAGGTNAVWEEAGRRLKAAGVTPQQVQVLWIKQALINPAKIGEFPAHAKALQEHLQKILTLAATHYPNAKIAYLSSRIYAGYAVTPLNPEPYAYESALAVRGVINDQLKAPEKSPLALWGPYLWGDGTTPRQADDLTWKREDLGPDGTHPSDTGRQKVADLLLNFFKSDPVAKTWFIKSANRPAP